MMKEKIKNITAIMLLISLVVFGLSCASNPSISLQVERPPNLNTSGISSIAIMPFEVQVTNRSAADMFGYALGSGLVSDQTTFFQVNENVYREMAQYATTVATNNIRAMNRFSIVDPAQADARFVGRITLIEVIDKENRPPMAPYSRTMNIEFNYSLVRPDGSVIGRPVSKRGGTTANASERGSLPDERGIIEELRRSIDHHLRNLNQDFVPYTVTERRTLARDRTKDDNLQAEMTNALELVNSRNYNEALEAYLGIYEKYKSIPAAENASIMYEVLGNTQTAKEFMERVVNETGDPKAQEILTRLNRILQDQAAAASF